ncbi:MAG: iron-containing redox enzyme family protein [Nitrososphaera sp.]|jgi:pyrroloquinoline-quinone synthase
MEDFSLVERIDSEIEKRSLLKHPFYQMWSKGQLELAHLRGYAKEYFQLVKAVPGMVDAISASAESHPLGRDMQVSIRANGQEEHEHLLPWIRFADSLGISSAELEGFAPAAKTSESVRAMEQLSGLSFEQAVAMMYAYEAELPKISRSKIEGLQKFYGLDSDDALDYFRIHEEADVRHAQVWRELLDSLPADRRSAAFEAAVRSLEAQNGLLDSVMRNHVSAEMCCS